ncbi:MAG: peptide chain release factor N(5)-glutamine methyltransferase [Synergistaceae bacterium]|jgi:release factor glutamine methyltransferase|nr:peptide chain release factor N(5)-glutamine methyltransferase [Synergistaceae bacterium]
MEAGTPKSVSSLRALLRQVMSDGRVQSPNLEADRIICGVLEVSRAWLLSRPRAELSDEKRGLALELARRRAGGEPLAYVLGDAVFRGRKFLVDRRTLIPRPETEMLTELADGFLKKTSRGAFADWCAGSGCIAVTLCADNPDFAAFAVDSSHAALASARSNAELHGVADRITFIECEDPVAASIKPESLDMAIANPPYIPSSAIGMLESQVRDYEPREALDGGGDGLCVYRLLLRGLPRFLKPGAPLFFETGGGGQVGEVAEIAAREAPSLRLEKVLKDHREITRFMLWRKLLK